MPALTTLGDGVRTTFQLPEAVASAADVTQVLVNGAAGPAVSSVANDLVTLASAPASGASVAITYKSRVSRVRSSKADAFPRPEITSYTAATKTLTGRGVPGAVIFIFIDGVMNWVTMADSTGAWSITFSSITAGTRFFSATQEPAPLNDYQAALVSAGLSAVA